MPKTSKLKENDGMVPLQISYVNDVEVMFSNLSKKMDEVEHADINLPFLNEMHAQFAEDRLELINLRRQSGVARKAHMDVLTEIFDDLKTTYNDFMEDAEIALGYASGSISKKPALEPESFSITSPDKKSGVNVSALLSCSFLRQSSDGCAQRQKGQISSPSSAVTSPSNR